MRISSLARLALVASSMCSRAASFPERMGNVAVKNEFNEDEAYWSRLMQVAMSLSTPAPMPLPTVPGTTPPPTPPTDPPSTKTGDCLVDVSSLSLHCGCPRLIFSSYITIRCFYLAPRWGSFVRLVKALSATNFFHLLIRKTVPLMPSTVSEWATLELPT